MMKLGPYELNTIVTGDARELAKEIPGESVDLIFTDPPYPKEFLWTFEWLAKEAARILVPGGSCMVMSGMQYFEAIFGFFCGHLDYHWLNAYYMPTVTQSLTFWPKKIWNMWKPLLWFTKGKRQAHHFVADGISNRVADKRFHKWGQSAYWALYWIDKLAEMDDLIIDPFGGGGTVAAVCKILGRNCLTFEIDPATAQMARERVALTQPPLFVSQPEQIKMEIANG